MKRRNFVQHSAVGLFGYNAAAHGLQALQFLQDSQAHDWFQKLISATGLKASGADTAVSDSLLQVVQSLNQQKQSSGYKQKKSEFYFYGESNEFCLYKLEWCHDQSGICDLRVPVLYRDADASWRNILTLNSFQLEALAMTIANLDGSIMPMKEVLLPVAKSRSVTETYRTLSGTLSIQTQISNRKAPVTNIEINSRYTSYVHAFSSRHCLAGTIA